MDFCKQGVSPNGIVDGILRQLSSLISLMAFRRQPIRLSFRCTEALHITQERLLFSGSFRVFPVSNMGCSENRIPPNPIVESYLFPLRLLLYGCSHFQTYRIYEIPQNMEELGLSSAKIHIHLGAHRKCKVGRQSQRRIGIIQAMSESSNSRFYQETHCFYMMLQFLDISSVNSTQQLNMAIEIVSFPMKNDGSFDTYADTYQRVAQ